MSTCTVCNHPQRHQIDAMLTQRLGYSLIGKQFGLGKDNVRRHSITGHVVPPTALPTLPAPAPPSPAGPAPTAVETLEALLTDLKATDLGGMSPAQVAAHRDMTRRVAVDLAKYQVAKDMEGPAQRELRVLEEMVEAGDEALERFPEARAAVADAIREWRARRGRAEEEGS